MTNLSKLDLNLLRVLDAMFRESSTIAASKRIGLSQPAVSAALGRLRHALNDPLFIRQGQKLVPTDYARSLDLPIRDMLNRLETILAGPDQFDPATSHETFRLTGIDFFAEHLFPVLANRLSELAPHMRVQMVDVILDDKMEYFPKFNLDIALIPKFALPSWLEAQEVLTTSYVVVARQGHPEISRSGTPVGDVLPLDLFCSLTHVLCSPEGKFWGHADAALEKIGRRRTVNFTAPNFSGVCNTVSQSNIIALLPHQSAENVADRLKLDIYLPPLPIPPVSLQIVWHKTSTNNPEHRWIRNIVVNVLAGLDKPPKIGARP